MRPNYEIPQIIDTNVGHKMLKSRVNIFFCHNSVIITKAYLLFQCQLSVTGQAVLVDDADGNLFLARVNAKGGIDWGEDSVCPLTGLVGNITDDSLTVGRLCTRRQEIDLSKVIAGLSPEHFQFVDNTLDVTRFEMTSIVKYILDAFNKSD